MKVKSYFLLAVILLFSLIYLVIQFVQASDPVIVVDFSGNASDLTLKPQSTPVQIGPGVAIGQGYAILDGTGGAFIDYGNGAENELRLFGQNQNEALNAMAIFARISSKQNIDTTGDFRVIISRWSPQQRSFKFAIKDDGKVYVCFTSKGDLSEYVEGLTVESNLVRNDASQTVDLTARFNRGELAIYVNGFRQQLTIHKVGNSQTIFNSDITSKTVIGGIINPTETVAANTFSGIINEIKIYGKALSEKEISSFSKSGSKEIYQNNCQLLGTLPSVLNPSMAHFVIEGNKEYEYMTICPVLCEISTDTIISAYHRSWGVDFYGKYNTYTRFSFDGGKTWGIPKLIARNIQAPGLIKLQSGDLLINALESENTTGISTTMRLYRSLDNGQNWLEQSPIWEKSIDYISQGGAGGLIVLNSGRILCPVFASEENAYSGEGTYKAFVHYSDDNGFTWQQGSGKVTLTKRGAMEPSVVELSDGILLMSLRTQLGEIYLSKSTDSGINWCPAWSSGLEIAEANQTLVRIKETNDLMIVWTSAPYDMNHHHSGERTPLSYAMSKDDGITWHKMGDIAGGRHELGTSSGNAILFTSTDKVIIANTLNFIAWDRNIYTGSIHVSIAERNYFYNRYSSVVDPAHNLSRIKLSWYKIIKDGDWYKTELESPGDEAQITVTGILSDDGRKKMAGEVVYSTSNYEIATVDSGGVVKITGIGTAFITAQVKHENKTFSDTMQIDISSH